MNGLLFSTNPPVSPRTTSSTSSAGPQASAPSATSARSTPWPPESSRCCSANTPASPNSSATADKRYTGHIRFGFATDTFDAEGTPLHRPHNPSPTHSTSSVPSATRFHGPIDQTPPIFSAKKINGVPAHKLARAGTPVECKTRPHHHPQLRAHSRSMYDTAAFTMYVSAGGYVRSVAHELGQLAGCGAHLSSLRRTQAGPFTSPRPSPRPAQSRRLRPTFNPACRTPRTLLPEMPVRHCRRPDRRTPAQRHAGQSPRLLRRPSRQSIYRPHRTPRHRPAASPEPSCNPSSFLAKSLPLFPKPIPDQIRPKN